MTISDDQLPLETQQKINWLASLTEKLLPLQKWGFRRSAQFGGMPYELPSIINNVNFHQIKNPVIIYDSKWCRFKITVDEAENDSLYFYYGRSHAPNNEWRLEWQGENCSCWHGFYYYNLALKFLDGLSPQEVGTDPDPQAKIISDYCDIELPIQPPKNSDDDIKMELELEARIWEHYGHRLFEIFDLGHPEAWNQYVNFVKECERLRKSHPVKVMIC